MTEFFTWQGLVTYSEAALATAMITQLVKEFGFTKKIPARIVSYIAALSILLVSTLATAGFDWKQLALTVLNAMIVALASNGAYEALAARTGRS